MNIPDQWLRRVHQDLLDALDDVLDIDAGLADATLPAHGTALVNALDQVLDLDAGLDDILPQRVPADHTVTSTEADSPPVGSGPVPLVSYARHFAQQPADARLIARTWFPLSGLAALGILARETMYLFPSGARHRNHGRTGLLAIELSQIPVVTDLSRILIRDGDVDLARVLDNTVDLVQRLGHALNHAFHIAYGRQGVQDFTVRRARDLINVLGTIDGNILGAKIRYASSILRALESSDIRAAERFAFHLTTKILDVLGSVMHRAVHTVRDAITVASRDNIFTAAVAVADAEDMRDAVDVLAAALSDVTDADLSEADLSGVPLEGVRWSSRTRWPANLVEDVRERSERIGPDLWLIVDRRIRVGETL